MKKFLLRLLLLTFVFCYCGNFPCHAFGKPRYDRIYEDMPILDHMYETRLDPEESDDYEKYTVSPYVLVRLPVKLRNKKTVFNQGYYLAKPEKRSGFNFVIFKQNGKVVGCVPVYKKYRVDPAENFPEPEKPKTKWYALPFVMTWNVIKWPFKKLLGNKKRPLRPPRAKAEFELAEDGKYYDMGLYVEDRLYKMLFILEK